MEMMLVFQIRFNDFNYEFEDTLTITHKDT